MKKILFIVFAFALVACNNSEDQIEDINANAGKVISITVGTPTINSNINQSQIRKIEGGIAGPIITFNWNRADILKVSSLKGDGSVYETKDFTITSMNEDSTVVQFEGEKPTVPTGGKNYFKIACGPDTPPTSQLFIGANLIASNMMRFENNECYLDKQNATVTLQPVWSVLAVQPTIYFHTDPVKLNVTNSYRYVEMTSFVLTQTVYDNETDKNIIKTLTVTYCGDDPIPLAALGASAPNVYLPVVVYPADVYDLYFDLTYNDAAAYGYRIDGGVQKDLKYTLFRYTTGKTPILSGTNKLAPGYAWNCGTPEASYTWSDK